MLYVRLSPSMSVAVRATVVEVSSGIVRSKTADSTGASLMLLTVTVKVSESLRLPSETLTVTLPAPVKSVAGSILRDVPLRETPSAAVALSSW